jgi:hypothetical protein
MLWEADAKKCYIGGLTTSEKEYRVGEGGKK